MVPIKTTDMYNNKITYEIIFKVKLFLMKSIEIVGIIKNKINNIKKIT